MEEQLTKFELGVAFHKTCERLMGSADRVRKSGISPTPYLALIDFCIGMTDALIPDNTVGAKDEDGNKVSDETVEKGRD